MLLSCWEQHAWRQRWCICGHQPFLHLCCVVQTAIHLYVMDEGWWEWWKNKAAGLERNLERESRASLDLQVWKVQDSHVSQLARVWVVGFKFQHTYVLWKPIWLKAHVELKTGFPLSCFRVISHGGWRKTRPCTSGCAPGRVPWHFIYKLFLRPVIGWVGQENSMRF